MSIATLLGDAMRGSPNAENLSFSQLGEIAQDALITALSEQAFRREVWEEAKFDVGDEVSVRDVHSIIDAAIRVLKGEVTHVE